MLSQINQAVDTWTLLQVSQSCSLISKPNMCGVHNKENCKILCLSTISNL